jgi:hypothetical protein
MAKITLYQNDEPFCLWCDRTKPATKAGWIEHRISHDTQAHFCSKKCLAQATLKGRGVVLDIPKLAARRRRKERGAMKAHFKEILEMDRLDDKDFSVFFLALSAKQKQVLACMGLGSLMGRFRRNPKKMLAEIERVKG